MILQLLLMMYMGASSVMATMSELPIASHACLTQIHQFPIFLHQPCKDPNKRYTLYHIR